MRFPIIPRDAMTPEQRTVADEIASGPRGGLRGPFQALLHQPDLARRVQLLGEHLRYKTGIPQHLLELAVSMTARRWTAQYEWFAHAKLARAAGTDPAIIDAIAEGRVPTGLSADQQLVYDFTKELLRDGKISDPLFARAKERFDLAGVLDLVGLIGYYSTVALVLNVAEVPLPEGEKPQLKPLAGGGFA
jgi:4-carboxymuconolactone decarboxylase